MPARAEAVNRTTKSVQGERPGCNAVDHRRKERHERIEPSHDHRLDGPLLGTVLGSSFVFFLKLAMGELVQKALLGFAAGAMMYVVVEELIPETQAGRHSNVGVVALALGFTLMMVLDVALG